MSFLSSSFLFLLVLSSSIHAVQGHVIVDSSKFPSVAYNFQFRGDAAFAQSGLQADIYLSGRPYFYGMEQYLAEIRQQKPGDAPRTPPTVEEIPMWDDDYDGSDDEVEAETEDEYYNIEKQEESEEAEEESEAILDVLSSMDAQDDVVKTEVEDIIQEELADDIYAETQAEDQFFDVVFDVADDLYSDQILEEEEEALEEEEVEEEEAYMYENGYDNMDGYSQYGYGYDYDYNTGGYGYGYDTNGYSVYSSGGYGYDYDTTNNNNGGDPFHKRKRRNLIEADLAADDGNPWPDDDFRDPEDVQLEEWFWSDTSEQKQNLSHILVATIGYHDDETVLLNITTAATSIQAKLIVLVLQDNRDNDNTSMLSHLWSRFRYWWNHKLPALERYLANNPSSDGNQLFFVIIPPRVQQHFFQSLYPVEGSIYDFELDDVSSFKGRDMVLFGLWYSVVLVSVIYWISQGEVGNSSQSNNNADEKEKHDFTLLQFTSDDLGKGEIQNSCKQEGQDDDDNNKDKQEPDRCAICLEVMPTGTSVCVLPCRHAFHPTCVDNWLLQQKQKECDSSNNNSNNTTEEGNWEGTSDKSNLYCCPLCKFDLRQHFVEYRAAKQELPRIPQTSRLVARLQRAWRRHHSRPRQVLLENSRGEGGDLELTVEDTQSTTTARDTEVNLVV